MPVTIDEYLRTSYEPESEFVDGKVLERHAGLRPHSLCLSNLIWLLRQSSEFVWPILRMRTSASRIRVPDICVTASDFQTEILCEPPLLCIEILSPEDELMYTLEKLEEYAAFGVRDVWLVDPWHARVYRFENGLQEAPRLSIPPAQIDLHSDDICQGLTPRP